MNSSASFDKCLVSKHLAYSRNLEVYTEYCGHLAFNNHGILWLSGFQLTTGLRDLSIYSANGGNIRSLVKLEKSATLRVLMVSYNQG